MPGSVIMAHELGHNLRLHHAPCDAGDPDSAFPYFAGTIGAWGYDFRAGRLVQPDTFDLMSYCGERWISDYHFTNALRYRIVDSIENAASVARPARALMLWGGVGVEGVPFLEPSIVVDAAPVLPEIGGDYRLSGRSADGRVLFDLTFDMRPIADGDGSSSFAFVLPAQPVWASDLVSITLTGPGGSAMLDGNSNLPISILRNPRTGQVRGVLRDLPLDESVPANGAEQQAAGFEALFSRGIPDVAVWRR